MQKEPTYDKIKIFRKGPLKMKRIMGWPGILAAP